MTQSATPRLSLSLPLYNGGCYPTQATMSLSFNSRVG